LYEVEWTTSIKLHHLLQCSWFLIYASVVESSAIVLFHRFGDKDVENEARWCEDRENGEVVASGEVRTQASGAAAAAVVQPASLLNMYETILILRLH
jgi:hypothetical protein